jgi:hypothetical protein
MDASSFLESEATGLNVRFVSVAAAGYFTHESFSTFTLPPPYPATHNIAISSTGVTRRITVATDPAGLQISVNGTSLVAPQQFDWTPSNAHAIATTTPQPAGPGTRFVFSGWSDGGAISHMFVVPNADATVTASFTTEHELTTAAAPSSGGSITGGGWFVPGAEVIITASPAAGFVFTGFSGDLTGTTNPQTIVIDGPKNVVTNFAPIVGTPDIAADATGLDFGTVPVGQSSPEQTVTVLNEGTAGLTVTVARIEGPDADQFSKPTDRCSNKTFAPGASCTVSVRFKPTSSGPKSATLRISSNDPDENPLLVGLTGGVGGAPFAPDITVSPLELQFGGVAVKKKSAALNVTITNDGTASLTVGTIATGGINAREFSIASDKCSKKTLAPGASCVVAVRFVPISPGVKTGVLRIPSNDPDESLIDVLLAGSGQ